MRTQPETPTISVVLIAPFETGFELSVRDSALTDSAQSGYGRIQRCIEDAEAELPHGTWQTDKQERANRYVIAPDDRRATTLVPKYLAERHISVDDIGDSLPERVPTEIEYQGLQAKLAVKSIAIRICDFGWGSLLLECAVQPTENSDLPGLTELKRLREIVECLSDEAQCFEPLLAETVTAVHQCIPRDLTDTRNLISAPKISWVHRVFMLPREQWPAIAPRDIETVVFRYKQEEITDLSITEGLSFFVGSGNSLCLYTANEDHQTEAERKNSAESRKLFAKVIQAQNLFYAKLKAMDRELFHEINQLSKAVDVRSISGFKKIHELESRSKQMVDQLESAAIYRSIYWDYAYHLDPQSVLIWKEIRDCWGTDQRIDAVEAKLETLAKIYDRTRNSLRSLYDAQLNWLVLAFTVAGFFSVFVDVVNFVQGDGLQWPDYVRTAILATMAGIIALLVYALIRRRTPI